MNEHLRVEQINKVKVKPVLITKLDETKVAGYKMFSQPYCNVFVVASKNSGKTVLLYNCLKKTVNKYTNVFLFSPTIHKDETYKAIIDMLESKKCNIHTYTDINGNDGENILKNIMDELNQDEKEKDEVNQPVIEMKPHMPKIQFGESINPEPSERKSPQKSKSRKIYAENIICLDDFGDILRSNTIGIANMLKINRHTLKGKTFILSHYITDIQPASIRQLDYLILFSGQNEDNLMKIYNNLGLQISFDLFVEAYKYATTEKYNFLYVDVKNNKFRKNFNVSIEFY